MVIKTFLQKYLMPLLAIIVLALALRDAASLLGVNSDDVSPISQMGLISFILMGIFTIFRLFAAVGMWIGAGWGAPLLVLVTIAELVLLSLGNDHITIHTVGLTIRLLLLFGVALWFALNYFFEREDIYD